MAGLYRSPNYRRAYSHSGPIGMNSPLKMGSSIRDNKWSSLWLKGTICFRRPTLHTSAQNLTYGCARISYFGDIRNACQSCGKCAQFQAQNSKKPMKSHPIPQYPWQFVSQDLCMFESHTYLVTIDHYSDFIEVDKVENTLSSTIVAKTEARIARHGVPEAILSDNGSQFTASEFEAFCEKYQIQHITSSPYWPKGNGKAEAAVKIVKRILKKSGKCTLQEALLTYRNTPQEGHVLSPAQRSMGRRTRGLLPVSRELLLPSDNTASSVYVQESIASKRAKAKQYYDATASSTLPPLAIGDFVYDKPSPHHKSGPWLYGLVTAVPAPRSYIIETSTGLTRRNRMHLRPAAPPPPEALIPRSWTKQLSVNPSEQTKPVPPSSTLKGSKPSTPPKPTQPSPTDTPSAPMPTSPPNVPQGKSNPLELNTKATVSHPRTGSNTHLQLKEGTVTKTRSGRVSKPAARLDL